MSDPPRTPRRTDPVERSSRLSAGKSSEPDRDTWGFDLRTRQVPLYRAQPLSRPPGPPLEPATSSKLETRVVSVPPAFRSGAETGARPPRAATLRLISWSALLVACAAGAGIVLGTTETSAPEVTADPERAAARAGGAADLRGSRATHTNGMEPPPRHSRAATAGTGATAAEAERVSTLEGNGAGVDALHGATAAEAEGASTTGATPDPPLPHSAARDSASHRREPALASPHGAAESLAKGRYADALASYRALARSAPEHDVFARIAAILERKQTQRCAQRRAAGGAPCIDPGGD